MLLPLISPVCCLFVFFSLRPFHAISFITSGKQTGSTNVTGNALTLKKKKKKEKRRRQSVSQNVLHLYIAIIFFISYCYLLFPTERGPKLLSHLLPARPAAPTLGLLQPRTSSCLSAGETAAETLLSRLCFPSAVQSSSCLSLSRWSPLLSFFKASARGGGDLFCARALSSVQTNPGGREPRLPHAAQRLTFAGGNKRDPG